MANWEVILLDTNTPEHLETLHISEIVITPEHAKRKESKEFRESKKRLKADGHYHCYICGTTENLQAHHFGAEWSLSAIVDFDKLKSFCEEWDLYGYGRLLKNTPITSCDDVRNFMILCEEHHTSNNSTASNPTGIHHMTFPIFIIQKLAKDGLDPVPQEGQTIQAVEDAIKEFQAVTQNGQ